jgi:16S rRNA (guanine527-N7)-methyltransferase
VSPVSRETAALAARVFGTALPLAERYAALLVGPGVDRGLLGPREAERIWERHLLNCAVVADALPRHARVADVGSGAGLPGLVLAIVRDDLRLHLVEPLQRRSDFLHEAVTTLGLANVVVHRARAEELAGRLDVDVVTARAVAPLDRLAGWCLPLLPAGGTLLALKGLRAAEELAQAEPVLRSLGAADWSVEQLGVDELSEPTTVVRVAVPARPLRPGRVPGAGRAGRGPAGGRPRRPRGA